ncbi:MAG: hypothetical protein IIA88_04735 [Bacteroidetes bacterium]|nr:hypothetical protein [Bacteroidota bacterium]
MSIITIPKTLKGKLGKKASDSLIEMLIKANKTSEEDTSIIFKEIEYMLANKDKKFTYDKFSDGTLIRREII